MSSSHRGSDGEAALGAIQAELFNEKIESLDRARDKAERALAALAACDGERSGVSDDALLDAAADSVWAYIVQRELAGLPGAAVDIRRLGVPAAVAARLGATRPR